MAARLEVSRAASTFKLEEPCFFCLDSYLKWKVLFARTGLKLQKLSKDLAVPPGQIPSLVQTIGAIYVEKMHSEMARLEKKYENFYFLCLEIDRKIRALQNSILQSKKEGVVGDRVDQYVEVHNSIEKRLARVLKGCLEDIKILETRKLENVDYSCIKKGLEEFPTEIDNTACQFFLFGERVFLSKQAPGWKNEIKRIRNLIKTNMSLVNKHYRSCVSFAGSVVHLEASFEEEWVRLEPIFSTKK